jgi:transposase InsO family protein
VHEEILEAVRRELTVDRDRLFALLCNRALLVAPKRKNVRTTYHDPALPVYRKLLYDPEPTRPHQVWVSDLTFISTDERFVYLSLITDLVSRRIVGWNAGPSAQASESLKALEMAIAALPSGHWPIHHTPTAAVSTAAMSTSPSSTPAHCPLA